ncbi:MAG TPA: transcription-repair coupling factor [Planctomycetota bacterium]|nr:transcription-repair coupling factor [Planctomycetota bacterium]
MPELPDDLLALYRASPLMDAARGALDGPAPELGGFWGASLAFFLGAWKEPGTPGWRGSSLVVTATQEEAEDLLDDLKAFTSAPVLPFPAWESLFLPDSVPDGEIHRQRLVLVERLYSCCRPDEPAFVVAPVQALLQPVPARERIAAARLEIRRGGGRSPARLAEELARHGFESVPLVAARGELSSRGDILDVFPHGGEFPLRIEFFGDTVESIRSFRPETQRSIAGTEKDEASIFTLDSRESFRPCFREGDTILTDCLGPSGRIFLKEPQLIAERAAKILQNLLGDEATGASRSFFDRISRRGLARVHTLSAPEGALNLRTSSVERFRGVGLEKVFAGISAFLAAGRRIDVYCENEAEAKRLREILADHGLEGEERLRARVGPVRRGFELLDLGFAILTAREIFNRHQVRRVSRAVPSRAIQSFIELSRGDHIVHLVHGVGRYLGMESFEKDGVLQEFLALEFLGGVKVYVPVSKIDLVQKYIGGGERTPILDKVGGTSWTRKKEEVSTALLDLASDLIDVQALRQARSGKAYPEDSEWQREFEAAFPFEDTRDQVEVSAAIKTDMQSSRPMDRLICGDVGYGKTELAMRAAFKAVDGGKQVAVLVPTTVLAQQHYRTFSERMAQFPVTVEVLSRFRTPAAQRRVIAAAAEGKVDILIGTHRILSADVAFHDLGLVIIDEEQRFGVTHKEKLKRMRSLVEVLTLSATPIPRTLHMALLGIRDISNLTTPPEGRSPVKTEISRFEPKKVREAVLRELNRDGQVCFVHNRVQDIAALKRVIEKIVPEARTDYAHGQMNEHELEQKMERFFDRDLDILIATTIIENGVDIPTVNTIFINEADRYGLADLHQLRGRVGRSRHQAYCYLLLPEHRQMNPEAERRVEALVEFSELGAGFQIAMRDLEIRGAGNILGSAQSGHIAAVGYEMYCRLLAKAVNDLKNEPSPEPLQVEIDLSLEAFIPDEYLTGAGGKAPAPAVKLELYRRLSQALQVADISRFAQELTDRFGPFPSGVERLLDVQRLRILCLSRGVDYVGREDRNIILKGREGMKKLLEGCPVRVVVLDARTVAVSLSHPARRYPPPGTDEQAFRTALEWLETGTFPEHGAAGIANRRSPITK